MNKPIFVLAIPPVAYLLFALGALTAYLMGECGGALGSGISCVKGAEYAHYASYFEVSIILAIPLAIVYVVVCLLGYFLFSFYQRRVKNTSH